MSVCVGYEGLAKQCYREWYRWYRRGYRVCQVTRIKLDLIWMFCHARGRPRLPHEWLIIRPPWMISRLDHIRVEGGIVSNKP